MSASAAVRARCARIIADVAMRGRSLDAALTFDAQATPQERGLIRSLSYDSIRWYLRLDALLSRLLTRPNQELAAEVRSLAIVGLCQLIYTDIPEHAAVDETVNAARVLGQPRAAGFINAILRRYQREHDKLAVAVDRDLATRTAHPAWLVQALGGDWGERAPGILEANNQRPPFWVRVNRLRCSGADYKARLEAEGVVVTSALFGDEALLLERAMDVADLPGFTEGLVSVQDGAAQLAARLVAPLAGERVLDACAAPGGKTGHLLELQPELAQLVAVDLSSERMDRVAQNLRRLGAAFSHGLDQGAEPAQRTRLIVGDAGEPDAWWDGRGFDRILLDVPCSATGVIRRHPDIKLLRRPEDIRALAERQLQLLRSSWQLLAPGGRLVYSSCSVLHAETVAVLDEFLSQRADARDVTSAALRALGPLEGLGQGAVGLRIAPGTGGMDGFYYACLEKT